MGDRVVASYCTTFLKPEMLHIYRQVRSLQSYRTFVMTKWLQNEDRFPFDDVEFIPKPHLNPLRHGWLKFVKRKAPIEYRGEYQLLTSLLEKRGADLMHIYFGHTGCAFAAVHRALEPAVRGLVPWSRCGGEAGDPRLRREVEELVQIGPAGAFALAFPKRTADRARCPPEKLRLCRTGVPLRQFPFCSAKRRPTATGDCCRRAG